MDTAAILQIIDDTDDDEAEAEAAEEHTENNGKHKTKLEMASSTDATSGIASLASEGF
jgi:hypothetical protein